MGSHKAQLEGPTIRSLSHPRAEVQNRLTSALQVRMPGQSLLPMCLLIEL